MVSMLCYILVSTLNIPSRELHGDRSSNDGLKYVDVVPWPILPEGDISMKYVTNEQMMQ